MSKKYLERVVLTADFVLAPSNRYCGWVVFNNGYWFGSGNTLLKMIRNIKQTLWKKYHETISFNIMLAPKPADRSEVPIEKMSSQFRGASYFNHKMTGLLTEEQAETFERMKPKVEPKTEPKVEPKPDFIHADIHMPKVNEEFVCEEKDGEMIVFKLVEVARFKLHKGANDVNGED